MLIDARLGIGGIILFRRINTDGGNFVLTADDDTALIRGNDDTVQGGAGNDLMSTSLSEDSNAALATYLLGGAGNDTLQADLVLDWDDYNGSETPNTITADLDGGTGVDEISIDASSFYADQSISADGGRGGDIITVNAGFEIPDDWDSNGTESNNVAVDVFGGSGEDSISVTVTLNEGAGTKIHAGSGNDTVTASDTYNEIFGDGGDDDITAIARVALFDSVWGHNIVNGGAGDDTLRLNSSENTAHGDEGDDFLSLEATGVDGLTNVATGDEGNDTLRLSISAGGFLEMASGSNEAHGGDGADKITVSIELNVGMDSNGDEVPPLSGLNTVYGDEGDDRLSARITVEDDSELDFARSELYGGAGDDRLSVKGGEGNILNGGAGEDVLLGGAGSDTLIGLQGDDYLRGRGGEDIFLFGYIRNGERDRVVDFTSGEDQIDLSQIDANVNRNGNQSFTFGTREGTGRAWIEQSRGSSSLLHADTGGKELIVVLQDGHDIGPDDYSASDFLL